MLKLNQLKDLTYKINGAAIEVHKILGPGLLESVYHKCLVKELSLRGFQFKSEFKIPYDYKGVELDIDIRCDLIIEDLIVVELKAVKEIAPIHEAQIMSYMKLLKLPKGIIYNFNVVNLYNEGQSTYINEYFKHYY